MEQGRNRVRVKGVPAQDGMSPFEAMLAAADEYVTPSQEFGMGGGTTTRELLDEQFAAGAQRMAERRRRAAERKGNR